MDGAGDTTGDGDEVGAGLALALAVGLAVRDECGELAVGLGLVGGTVGVRVVGVTVGRAVVWLFTWELVVTDGGLTQR